MIACGLSLVTLSATIVLGSHLAILRQRLQIIQVAPDEGQTEFVDAMAAPMRLDVARLAAARRKAVVLRRLAAVARSCRIWGSLALIAAAMFMAVAITAVL